MTEFSTKTPNPQFPDVYDLHPQEISEKMNQFTIIDVRQPDEFIGELGHIPSAQLLVLDYLPEKIESVSKTKPILFVCRSGSRSARATAFALQNGFEKVYNMYGGMILWNELHFPTEK